MSVDPGRSTELIGPDERVPIEVRINGVAHVAEVEPRLLLTDFLRHEIGLTGTHVGCEHGVCGACSVRVGDEVVRGCLLFAAQADGADIWTIEGLSDGSQLHPVQEAFRERHGLQCGFCTPGLVLATQRLLEDAEPLTDDEIREELSGNICRCTGYVGVVEAVKAAMQREG